jgi:hypothetical protein
MEDNYFMFRNQVYRQTEGACMGSCLSPFIADIFMKTFEKNLSSSPIFPKCRLRYVDEIFVILKKSQINKTLNWLNSQHQKIQFTMEEEQSGQLPFLDVMVKRQDNQLVFDVYQKPTMVLQYQEIHSCWFVPSPISKERWLPSNGASIMQLQSISEEKYLKE